MMAAIAGDEERSGLILIRVLY